LSRFLQKGSDGWVIEERAANTEHGIAAVSCLLSGWKIFIDTCDEQTRSLRLIKGVHGFHVYATEYWTDYVLNEAVDINPMESFSPLFVVTSRLVDILDERFPPQQPNNSLNSSDRRLEALQQQIVLHRQIEYALLARSRKRLDSELLQDCGTL
jgi:hypothetical protein